MSFEGASIAKVQHYRMLDIFVKLAKKSELGLGIGNCGIHSTREKENEYIEVKTLF
jgi:hypothetical protein